MASDACDRFPEPPTTSSRIDALRRKFGDRGACVAGVLSGTSADGIGVVIAIMRGCAGTLEKPCILAAETIAFPSALGRRVRAVLDGEPTGLRACALLARDLGRAFGSAAAEVARNHGLAIDVLGSHGQTVWHHDGNEADGAATLQLGDGDFAAEAAGCFVVSDFRQRDIAAGGEGAPLSALADGLIFHDAPRPCAILNLGGMGNLTVLGEDPADILAFDTGPANSLLDGIARRLLDRPFDGGGECALRGRSNERLVAELSMHPFLSRKPPRSTGRDTFGEAWVGGVIERARAIGMLAGEHGVESVMASAVEFVASCVGRSVADFVTVRVDPLIVAGGGAHNRALMLALERRTRARVIPSDEFGVPAEAREGLVFAVLAARCVLEIPSTHPGATGAESGRVLGKMSLPSAGTVRHPIALGTASSPSTSSARTQADDAPFTSSERRQATP